VKKSLLFVARGLLLSMYVAKPLQAQQYEFPFQNPNLPLEPRADNIVSLLTLDEKTAVFTNPAVARDVARESAVLLKNAGGLLPLSRQATQSIAVIGPRASEVLFDLYSGVTQYAVIVLQGIRDKAGSGITVSVPG